MRLTHRRQEKRMSHARSASLATLRVLSPFQGALSIVSHDKAVGTAISVACFVCHATCPCLSAQGTAAYGRGGSKLMKTTKQKRTKT